MSKDMFWIRQCVLSALSPLQLKCCKVMVDLFSEKYKGDDDAKDCIALLLQTIIDRETFLSPDL